MKIYRTVLLLILMGVYSFIATDDAAAQNLCGSYSDPENHTWLAQWTDSFGETTYSLIAPCKVFVDIPFTVTAYVDDPNYVPSTWVGGLWSILDTPQGGSATTLGSGFWIDLDQNHHWENTISVTYTGTPVDHTIQFRFTDLGQGSGGHNYAGSIIGDVTVDPYPPVVPEPVSTALFVTGGTLLAGRRWFRKKRA